MEQMWKKLNRLGRILIKNPNNHFDRGQCFNRKRKYEATCKKEKRKVFIFIPMNSSGICQSKSSVTQPTRYLNIKSYRP